MRNDQVQLSVIKNNGSIEEYMHTKIIGSFNNALAFVDQSNVYVAEQLADAVTFNLYQKNTNHITCDEIHLLIGSALSATGYPEAAQFLSEYRNARKMKRNRTLVICQQDGCDEPTVQWNKSRIVEDIMKADICNRHVARAIASSVEEKILNIAMPRVPAALIKQLVNAETEAMLQAQEQLQEITN